MTADSLDLPSNVLVLRTLVLVNIKAGERPTVVFCQIILALSSEENFNQDKSSIECTNLTVDDITN